MTFRVTLHLRTPMAALVQDALVRSFSRPGFERLESKVKATDEGVEVALRVDAGDESAAAVKGCYWLERAGRAPKGMRYTGKMYAPTVVESWT